MLEEKVEKIQNKEDFVRFLQLYFRDFQMNRNNWENNSLEYFLEAMAAWVDDMDGFYKQEGKEFDPEKPTWKNFGEILLATRMYE
jgi:hypothetical protein